MSEKLTYNELVSLISEEAGLSHRFAEKFTKKLVELIRRGLVRDGKVNISKFGKFEIQEVSEKEGRDPNTGEPITIPAHQRVVFKPYKNVRERVNAPYKELEPEFLNEQSEEPEIQSEKDLKGVASPNVYDNEPESISARLGISEQWFLFSILLLLGGMTLLSLLARDHS